MWIRHCLLFIMTVLFSGCISLTRPAVTTYIVKPDVSWQSRKVSEFKAKVVKLRVVSVKRPYDDPYVLVLKKDGQFVRDYYHRLADDPGRFIHDVWKDWLMMSGVVETVEPYYSRLNDETFLKLILNEWYVDLSQGQPALVIGIDCHMLKKVSVETYEDLFHQTIKKRVLIKSINVNELQIGLSVALHQAFEEFLLFWGVS